MRRPVLVLTLAISLSGCISFGGPTGPGRIPGDAFGAMYSNRPSAELADCLATKLGGTMQQNGDRIVITAPDQTETYDVGANANNDVYSTEVILRGRTDTAMEERAGICLTGSAAAS